MPAVTVLAPAYNEEDVLEGFVQAATATLPGDWELLVVDDGSTDETPALLARLTIEHPSLRIVTHPVNRGLGAALATGFSAARGDVVVTIDADLSHPLALVPDLVAACETADAAFGSRFVPGGGMPDVPPLRRVISQLGNLGLRFLLRSPVHDMTTGLRAYRTPVARSATPASDGFEAQIEITVRLLAGGASIVERPLVLRTRAAGSSKMRYGPVIARYLRLLPSLVALRRRPGARSRRPPTAVR